VLQRLGVSSDGSLVAFEVTDDFSFFAFTAVPPEAEGMFLVRTDGSGLRRLGPPSRDPSFRIAPSVRGTGFDVSGPADLPFSPDRRRIVFTDVGPGPGDEDAVQVVALDLATGRRTQLTHLPAGSSPFLAAPVTFGPRFVDDETRRSFSTRSPIPEARTRRATSSPSRSRWTAAGGRQRVQAGARPRRSAG